MGLAFPLKIRLTLYTVVHMMAGASALVKFEAVRTQPSRLLRQVDKCCWEGDKLFLLVRSNFNYEAN